MMDLADVVSGPFPSELPWALRTEEDWDGQESYWIESANGHRVADQVDYYPTAVSENDMRAIVRAVNAHDALVAALEEALGFMDDAQVVGDLPDTMRAALALARA